ncbi:MAG TPA: dephospho-CoA kinase [Bacteroidales bacterium]|jgi:dephospho-CoA kinase|nr:dephospho-CoA kinase [Bacteroidales bacterium]
MISIGLTGGIGSGKTTVSQIFKYNWNIPVYYADERAKWLMQNNESIKTFLLDIVGQDSYSKGSLNKEYIASVIFNNSEVKSKLESVVHKAVIEDYEIWKSTKIDAPYIIHEAALIFESQLQDKYNKIISVISPLELRIKRLMEKGMNIRDVEKRIDAQTTDDFKIKNSDFVIYNNETCSILEQVINIHTILTNEMG